MQTGMFDAIIRPIADKTQTPSRPSRRATIEVSFDPPSGKLRVDEKITDRPIILLQNAEFHVRDGERVGCDATGKLGFVVGEEITQGQLGMDIMAKMEPVRWNHTRFTTGHHKSVYSAEMVLVVGSTMMVLEPITD